MELLRTIEKSDVVSKEEFKRHFPPGYLWSVDSFDRLLSKHGIYSGSEFMSLLFDYLNLSPHEAIKSEIPLWRALAIVDRRIGKRTLKSYSIDDENDPVVHLFHLLRTKGISNIK